MAKQKSASPAQIIGLIEAGSTSPTKIAEGLSISRSTAHRMLNEITDSGVLVRVDNGPKTTYRIKQVSDFAEETNLASSSGDFARFTLSPAAAHSLRESLELFFRVGFGQIEEVINRHSLFKRTRPDGSIVSFEDVARLEVHTNELRRLILRGQKPLPVKFEKSWDMMTHLRHRLAWDQCTEGGMTVSFDDPHRKSTETSIAVYSDRSDSAPAQRYFLQVAHSSLSVVQQACAFAYKLAIRNFKAIPNLLLEDDDAQTLATRDHAAIEAVCDKMSEVLGLGNSATELLRWDNYLCYITLLLEQTNKQMEAPSLELTRVATAAQEQIPDATVICESSRTAKPIEIHQTIPAGYFLGNSSNSFQVITRSQRDGEMVVVSDSRSLQTALCHANNLSAGRDARNFSL